MTEAPQPKEDHTRTALDSVLDAEQEMERRVLQARERAEQQVKQARVASEARVAREKERIAAEVARDVEARKRRLDAELAREAVVEGEKIAGAAAGLGPMCETLRKRILDLITGS